MKKIKTSMKIVDNFKNVFSCGYCDLEYIFKLRKPVYYNAGVYGWNCDLYVDWKTDTIISTGYRNTRGLRIPSAIINRYNKKAKAIYERYPFQASWEETEKQLDCCIDEFIADIIACAKIRYRL